MKKVISIALTLVLLVSMSVVAITSASADTTAKIHGKSANVGDTVTLNMYFQVDKQIEDFQGNLNFDSTVLKLVSFEMPNISVGGMYNTTYAGVVYYSGSSFDNPYDFTKEKVFAKATFTVSKAGTTDITSVWEACHDTASVSVLNSDDTLSSRASERFDITVTAPASTTKPSTTKPTTKPTTNPTTKPTTKPTTGTNPTVTDPTATNPTVTEPDTRLDPPVVKVTKVSLNTYTKTINAGKTYTLKATCTPDDAADKSVSWSSTNKKVATVTQSGKVTAKTRGTAYIKATAKDGSKKSAQCRITVKQLVTKVKLDVTKKTLKLKKSFKVKATVSPSNANNNKIKWTVSKKNIVKISSTKTRSGNKIKVTAKKKGKVNLIATAADGSKKSAKCKITVKK